MSLRPSSRPVPVAPPLSSRAPRPVAAAAVFAALSLGAALALGLGGAGCVTGPTNGTTVSGSVVGKALFFSGYHNVASTQIRLQVMTDPTLNPATAANWVDFATATTGTTPTYVNSTDPLYSWSVTAAPVPTAAQASRWPQGGLVRVRAITTSGSSTINMVTFDEATFGTCLGEHLVAGSDWSTIGLECAGTGNNNAALVSTSNIPAPASGSACFLGRKGTTSPAETVQYYTTTNAPTTLAAFKSRYGFTGAEVNATYYNNGDLGLGREMHCKTYTFGFFPPRIGLACYVSNYSGVHSGTQGIAAFNVNPTTVLADAVNRQFAFATVAMTYEPPNGPNAVKFVVYDVNGNRANTAQLDSTANNISIPNNCLSCHGINSFYNETTNEVSADARFLPFDPFSFRFSTATGFTSADQAEPLRQLNNLVLAFGNPTQATADFINGTYPAGVNTTNAPAVATFIPPTWDTSGSLDGHALYDGVVKVACRTCHMSAVSTSIDFNDYADFSSRSERIKDLACGTHEMPHAERVFKNYWESGARAYLISAFPASTFPDTRSACKP
jgi:hypothetical protein